MAFPNSPERATEPDIERSHFRCQVRTLDGYTYLRGCERRWADGIWRPVEGYNYYEVEASEHDTPRPSPTRSTKTPSAASMPTGCTLPCPDGKPSSESARSPATSRRIRGGTAGA